MTIGPYSTMELNKGLSCPTSISIMLQINVPHIKSIQGIGLLIWNFPFNSTFFFKYKNCRYYYFFLYACSCYLIGEIICLRKKKTNSINSLYWKKKMAWNTNTNSTGFNSPFSSLSSSWHCDWTKSNPPQKLSVITQQLLTQEMVKLTLFKHPLELTSK